MEDQNDGHLDGTRSVGVYQSMITQLSELAARVAWKKKDRMALSTIRLRVANKVLVYIVSLTMTKEAWDTLKSLLEAQGALRIVQAWQKLF